MAKKKEKSKNDDVKVTVTTMRLPVKLDDEELLDRGQQLVKNMRKAAAAEEARDAENKKRKGEIAMLDEITAKLSGAIALGTEERDVECEVRKDYRHGRVTTVRTDTGEVVDERTMTAQERQETMPFSNDDADPRGPNKGKGGDPFADGDSSDTTEAGAE